MIKNHVYLYYLIYNHISHAKNIADDVNVQEEWVFCRLLSNWKRSLCLWKRYDLRRHCLRKAKTTQHNSWKYECTKLNLKILQWNPCYFSCSICPSTQPDSAAGQRKAASGKSVRKFFAENHVLPRPALSPDLNQIEHSWNELYKRVRPSQSTNHYPGSRAGLIAGVEQHPSRHHQQAY